MSSQWLSGAALQASLNFETFVNQSCQTIQEINVSKQRPPVVSATCVCVQRRHTKHQPLS